MKIHSGWRCRGCQQEVIISFDLAPELIGILQAFYWQCGLCKIEYELDFTLLQQRDAVNYSYTSENFSGQTLIFWPPHNMYAMSVVCDQMTPERNLCGRPIMLANLVFSAMITAVSLRCPHCKILRNVPISMPFFFPISTGLFFRQELDYLLPTLVPSDPPALLAVPAGMASAMLRPFQAMPSAVAWAAAVQGLDEDEYEDEELDEFQRLNLSSLPPVPVRCNFPGCSFAGHFYHGGSRAPDNINAHVKTQHMQKFSQNDYQCLYPECSHPRKNVHDLKRHIITAHLKLRPYKCVEAEYFVKDKHLIPVNQAQRGGCQCTFLNTKDLKVHLQAHARPGFGEKCFSCNAWFQTAGGLSPHQERCHP